MYYYTLQQIKLHNILVSIASELIRNWKRCKSMAQTIAVYIQYLLYCGFLDSGSAFGRIT